MDPNNEPPKVMFENEQFQRPRSFQATTPKMVEWIIRYSGGAIKDEKQANYVLIGFVVVAIVISIFLVFGGGGSKAKFEAPPGQKIIYPENAPPYLQKQL